MIEVKHLTKYYSETAAVCDLSFTVNDGRIYGFLGPNGAGKTTTMNMITGSLAPTSGEVLIDGLDIFKEPKAAKKSIGYLPEIPPLYPDLTVGEYLRFAAELKKTDRRSRSREISDVLNELGLLEVENRLIRNLSKGFRQRTGIAQALIGNPGTLILDEPTAGLDPKQITEIRALIRELGKKHTVLLSSHILSEVNEICDEILIISRGKLVASGTPESLRAPGYSGDEIIVTVEGEEEIVRSALAEEYPSGAGSCRILPGGDGTCTIHLRTENAADAKRSLGRALAAQGLVIIEMKTETESLEDVFLRLTSEDERAAFVSGRPNGSDL